MKLIILLLLLILCSVSYPGYLFAQPVPSASLLGPCLQNCTTPSGVVGATITQEQVSEANPTAQPTPPCHQENLSGIQTPTSVSHRRRRGGGNSAGSNQGLLEQLLQLLQLLLQLFLQVLQGTGGGIQLPQTNPIISPAQNVTNPPQPSSNPPVPQTSLPPCPLPIAQGTTPQTADPSPTIFQDNLPLTQGQVTPPVAIPVPNSSANPTGAAPAGATMTFDDEFDTASWHGAWQQGDLWQLIAPDSPDGRGGPQFGELGDQYWVNPSNPSTVVDGLYSVANGQLALGLMDTPANIQSAIDSSAGKHMPYVGAIINNYPANYQHFGYWNFGMSCPKVAGMSCEISMENVQVTGHWPPQLNIGVSNDANGNQTVHAQVNNPAPGGIDKGFPFDGTGMHDYGVDWEADNITFYVDGKQIYQTPNPGGVLQTDNMYVFVYTGANYSMGAAGDPPTGSLPAYAKFDYFRIYSSGPK